MGRIEVEAESRRRAWQSMARQSRATPFIPPMTARSMTSRYVGS